MPEGEGDAAATTKPRVGQRLNSLDTFRGLSLTLMIFVNYGGGNYWYFQHASWDGLTPADVLFPWFLWMMGTSMIFSFRGMLKRNTPPLLIVRKIVWRAIKLFAIGLFMGTKWGYSSLAAVAFTYFAAMFARKERKQELSVRKEGNSNDLSEIRITGVLQRFGLTYLVASLAYLPVAKRAKSDNTRLLGDIIPFWPEWLIHAALLAVYLALTFALEVPGCPTGYLGPGGLHNFGNHWNCTGGAAGYADLKLFTSAHIYNYPTSRDVYYTTQAFDPEGFFTVIPTIFLVLLGNQASKIIVMHKGNPEDGWRSHARIMIRWGLWAVVTGGLALLLCGAKRDGGWIPLNKNLWSMSYILAMAATSYIMLGILYFIIDVKQWWNGAPFIFPGMNSILIYICHSVFSGYFPVSWEMPDWTSHWQMLLLACWGSSFWVFVAYILHRNKFYYAL